jgi:hypothetical protein
VNTLADLVTRDRRSDAPALSTSDREMDYRRFCTTAWKASNYLRHLGVAGDRGVVVLTDESPPPLLTFFGAALLNVPTRFVDSVADLDAVVDSTNARAVLLPAEAEDTFHPPAGVTLSVHGGDPADPATDHWEGGVWSENPAFVPSTATADSVALTTESATLTHGHLLSAGRRVADDHSLSSEDTVGVTASLADPRVLTAGVVAPLLVGGSVRLGPGPTTVMVGQGEGPSIDPSTVSLGGDA